MQANGAEERKTIDQGGKRGKGKERNLAKVDRYLHGKRGVPA